MTEKLKIKSVTGHWLDNQLSWPLSRRFPAPLVILCHGFLAHRRLLFFPALQRMLLRQGYAVFSYDLPGHGSSPGDKSAVTLERNLKDLQHIINILADDKRLDLNRLSVIGHSFGGITALMSGAGQTRVKRVVAIGSALNFGKVLRQLLASGKMIQRDGFIYYRIGLGRAQRCDQTLWPYSQKFEFAARVKQIRVPVLLIAGGQDKTMPLELVTETYRRLTAPKKLFVIKSSGHFFIKPWPRRQMFKVISQWLKSPQ